MIALKNTLVRSPIVAVIGAFILLALIYMYATPPLEASDELWHVGMVDFIADTGTLPVQNAAVATQYEQEGSQPPLYYLLGAVLVAGIDRTDFAMVTRPNPHAKAGIALDSDNKNLVLHDTPHPAAVGTFLAVYVLRTFSILLSAMTVFAVYRAAREVASVRVALLAAGITAFNPMFLFISASVNNDTLVTLLNSLIVWQVLVLLRQGFDTRRSLLIAVLFAAASLSKLSGLLTAPLIVAGGFWLVAQAWRMDRVRFWQACRGLLWLGGGMVVVWLVLAGWWYARNLMLYGELFGTRTMVAVAGARLEAFSLTTLLAEFEGFRIAYWGLFGAVNVLTWQPFYSLMDLLTLLAIFGMLWQLQEQLNRVALVLLLVLLGLGFVSVIAWTAQTYASQGRLLFPVTAATSVLLAAGWQRLTRWSVWGILPLGVFALIVPFASILPAYAPPIAYSALAPTAQPVYASWGDVALIGYEIPQTRYTVGDRVPVTLYWQVNQPLSRDYSLFLHLVSPTGSDLGKVDTYPGGGRLQATQWQPGIYADHYTVQITEPVRSAFGLRVQVGWYQYPQQTRLPATAADSTLLEAVMLDAGGFAHATDAFLDDMTPAHATFGNITLLGYRQSGRTLSLLWQADGSIDDNYTVFVQALGTDNAIVAQGDASPDFPTRYWRSGERYVTVHPLSGDATGTFPVVIGWYRLPDFQRLPTERGDGAYALLSMSMD